MIAYAAIFDTEERARAAAAKLSGEGFSDVLTLGPAQGAGLEEALRTARRGEFLTTAGSKAVGDALASGRAAVFVKAPLGRGRAAESALDKGGGKKLAVEATFKPKTWFFSDVIGLPLISTAKPKAGVVKNPTPFSSMFGMPTISKPTSPRTTSFGFPLSTQSKHPLSDMFGLPILSQDRRRRG